MKLIELANIYLDIPEELASLSITDLAIDSRNVQNGSLFFGLPGSVKDGADFVAQAAEQDCVAAVVSTKSNVPETDIPIITSDNPRAALALAAARFYEPQPQFMAAVTGTAGKTSVATFLRQIWESAQLEAASIGTTGVVAPGRDEYGNLTTPDTVSLHKLLKELAQEGVTHAAMEASSHGLDQFRMDGVTLSAGAFTNLGRDHLDYHPSVEEYLNAKMRLFRQLLPKDKPAIIFADDPFSQAAIDAAQDSGLDVKTVGRAGEFIGLKKVEHRQFNQVVELDHENTRYFVSFPLAGDFQISNALVAAGLAIVTGVAPEQAFKALEKLKGASGRLEMVGKLASGAPTYVDYAHKPEAMENVLQSLRPFCTGRIILVFGCGGDRDPGKRPIMGEIANRLADVVIVTDDNPRTEDPSKVRGQILAACEDAVEIADRREAIFAGCDMLKEGDCLVVAGKGHEVGQIIGNEVLPFSDHEVLLEAMGKVGQ